MTKDTSKSNTNLKKPKKTRAAFKPDIRIAHAIIGAIAFLQKAGLQGTPKVIKKCINERSRTGLLKNMEQLPLYLNRGMELGILQKRRGCYKLGNFRIRKRTSKKRQAGDKHNKKVEVIKDANGDMKNAVSARSSVCAF